MFRYCGRLAPVMCVIGVSAGLSGCVALAAAAPLISVGMAAFSGFEAYKTIQLAGGSSVEIEFPGKDGKTAPPERLPSAKRVAVWPGDPINVQFAQKLEQSGRYRIVGPATVAADLANAKLPTDLNQMMDQERDSAFASACRSTGADLLFAAQSQGTQTNSNVLSFSSANVTSKVALFGYSCSAHAVVWQDEMQLVVSVGSGSTPSDAALAQAAGDAWADRVIQAAR